MNKAYLTKGACVLLLYLLSLIATLPARLINWLPLPPTLSLTHVSGSLWNGSIEQLDWQHITLHQLRWQLVLHGGLPAVEILLQDERGITGHALLRWFGHWQLRDTQLKTPAAQLIPWLELPLPVAAGGNLSLSVSNLAFSAGRCRELDGRLRWHDATLTTLNNTLTLEKATLTARCQAGNLAFSVQQSSPQLTLSGQGQITTRGQYRANGLINKGQALPPMLEQAINRLPQAGTQDQHAWEIAGLWTKSAK